jgi:hypothetical protein
MESSEVMSPLIANSDSSRTIFRVVRGVRVCAALDHSSPDPVERMPFHAVDRRPGDSKFALQASTGLSVSSPQCVGRHDNRISAIALASPVNGGSADVGRTFGQFNNEQSAVSLAYAILQLWRAFSGIIGVHKKLPFLCLIQGRFVVAAWCFCVLRSFNYSTGRLN